MVFIKKVTHTTLETIIDFLYYICKPSLFNLPRCSVLTPSLLKEIEEISDPNAAYSFIPLMFVKNKAISRLANEKVQRLLNSTPFHFFNKIDEKIRKSTFSNHDSQISEYWYDLKPSIIDAHKDQSIESFTVLKILCCHPNGYIRYKAIKTLVENSIQDAIPFLFIRANDWVEEIRVLCLATLNNILKNELICHFVEFLPLLEQLKIKGRTEHMYDRIHLISKIESLLTTECSDALFMKINSHEIIIARYAFAILANSDSKIEQLLTATLNNNDIIIKVNAFNLARKQYDCNQFLIYLNKIKYDKIMLIRKMVLYAFIEHYPDEAKKILENALLDNSRSIRNLSRYYLKQQGISEFSDYYIKALTGRNIKQAILGLSESFKKRDFRYIRPFISERNSKLNSAIIYAAFKMQPRDWKNVVTQLLSNPDSTTLKAFTNCILENQESYTLEEILELVYKKNNLMHIRYLIRILSNGHYDRWVVLNFILCELEIVTDQDVKVVFETYFHTWINHNSPSKIFTRPCHEKSKMCLDKANKLLKDNPADSVYKELLGNIKAFIK